METAAHELGMDPAELRRINFIHDFPYQTPVLMSYDVGDYDAHLDRAIELGDYKGYDARKAASEKAGKIRGIGMCCYIEACGVAPSAAVGALGARRRAVGKCRYPLQPDRPGGGLYRHPQPRPGP